MGFITCATCKSNHGVAVGTLNEKQYFRVIPLYDTRKLYFCKPACYLERCFMDHVFSVSQRKKENISIKDALAKPELRRHTKRLKSNYETIVEDANNHPSFEKWCKERGYDWKFIETNPSVPDDESVWEEDLEYPPLRTMEAVTTNPLLAPPPGFNDITHSDSWADQC